ncbi:hypothetical protein QBC46DRAFT_306842 [Diplogelasinospora grovesii]|uniref:DUF1479-domain-containing protein n=1 Tax=Diplogelasinospora grovesii TaxID=303347 RepID=A0AAN6S7V7_9PEZI|nr:hypothetical protein QBC46DRAFT_306842 [Diplogelasinospora grovesii]
MGNSTIPSVDKISGSEFAECLGRYASCIEAISESKGAKAGQKTLAELDQYRYGEALDAFGSGKVKATCMGLDDVKTLVEWKLRHGKFRPALMKLVSSNDPKAAQETIQKAFKLYQDKSDVSAALGILTQLKGIGPATASLLLAVHDPENVIFFADEAFYWLCCGGSKAPIKYNLKEYTDLNTRAQAVAKRLGVKAVDVERVAFVLMRQPPQDEEKQDNKKTRVSKTAPKTEKADKPKAPSVSDAKKPAKQKQPAKRKRSGALVPIPERLNISRTWTYRRLMTLSTFSCSDPISLPQRFAILKQKLVSGREDEIVSSWQRLLRSLEEEIDSISSSDSQRIPVINYADINSPRHVTAFECDLRKRGVAIIRGVVSRDTAAEWGQETLDHLASTTTPAAATEDGLHEVYWSAAQVKARAHPNVLSAQKFAMSLLWKSKDPNAQVSTNFPVSYADRIRTTPTTPAIPIITTRSSETAVRARVDGGSVERWEPDGYGGRSGTYSEIFNGSWESYDPWESSTRIKVTSDLYHGAGSCSIFRMFNGFLSLSDTTTPDLKVFPELKLATAYFLLRPFFSQQSDGSWVLIPDKKEQNSILHGALPSYAQQITNTLHPHLQLDRSLVRLPDLEAGDYVIFHPDLVHATTTLTSPPLQNQDHHGHAASFPTKQIIHNHTTTTRDAAVYMYLPACPLTQTNALYLCRQRKAFLLGYPGPDFDSSHRRSHARHHSHPTLPTTATTMTSVGVQDVNDAGGDDGLRAMGLLPFSEEDVDHHHEEEDPGRSDAERRVLAVANAILFPDLYDML